MSRYRPDHREPGAGRVQPMAQEQAVQQDFWATEPEVPVMPGVTEMTELLTDWVEAGWLRALDLAFARFVLEQCAPEEAGGPELARRLLLAALLSHQVGRGHVCLDLKQLVADPGSTLALPPDDLLSGVDTGLVRPSTLFQEESLTSLQEALAGAGDVTVKFTGTDQESAGEPPRPMVLAGTRLYLHRYWEYEQGIAAGIRQRLAADTAVADAGSVAAGRLRQALAVLFGEDAGPDYQKLACALAARHRFAVITGGPGTGKTTTVVRLLAALQSVAERPLRIRLAAPTGKAAARLSESISQAVSRLPLQALPGSPAPESIPVRVTTLHRLLGSLPGSRRFRYNPDNPLPVDLLVIDEASMVDVELMASVFGALPASASLILLGDKDQLASVDAGAVLGELCQRAASGHYRPETADWLSSITGQQLPSGLTDHQGEALDQAVAMLRQSHRFKGESGIGVLAKAVNETGLRRSVIADFRAGVYGDVAWLALPSASRDVWLQALIRHCLEGSPGSFGQASDAEKPVGYRHYLTVMKTGAPGSAAPRAGWDQWAARVLEAFGQFQVLCALRRGPLGVEGINEAIAQALREAGLIERAEGWYAGRPVLVTGNDYNLGLMNGDVGITLPVSQPDGRVLLRVAFPAGDGSEGIHWVSPSRLQAVETVYAMTVHKSQGSEFGHVCLLVPDRLAPVLTRELVYTGITRARQWLSLAVANPGVLEQAVAREVIRASGLAAALAD